ncbi:MAG TPA: GNAT family N-acetyltransferase, partial [Devosia sp.]|nr:GNAT family N-acetyltransferase [Devosia sp.]
LDAADPPRILKLIQATGVFSPEEARVAAELAETTLSGTETYRWLLAEADGRLVGYTCFDRIPFSRVSFDLYWIAVLPERRGTGLAGELMQRTAKFVRLKRGTQIFAETSSRPAYAPARAFYERYGFETVARFDDFYEPGDAKITYRLRL